MTENKRFNISGYMNKRFVDYFDKEHNYIIQDLQEEDKYQVGFVNCDEDEFLELVNELHEENVKLKQRNKVLNDEIIAQGIVIEEYQNRNQKLFDENEELKRDNDIKFWKQECMIISNSNSLFISELGKAIKQDYEVSDEFKEYMDEIKKREEENWKKSKRLFND